MEEIKYIEKGKSPDCLFLIHGFCSGPEDWSAQIDFYSKFFTVIAPTLRGHDGENINNRPMSIEQLSNDCVKIVKKKKFKKIIISGHSMGTRIAIDMANKVSNVSGIILVDGSRFSNYETYFSELSNFENSLNEYNYKSILTTMFSSMFFSSQHNHHKERIVERAINVPHNYSIALRRNTIWYDSHCIENNLKNLNLPILLLHSTKLDKDKGRAPIKVLEEVPYINFVRSLTNNLTIKIFEETGHYITIEEPETVNNLILEWLKGLKIHLR